MALTTVNSDGVKDDSIKNIDVKSDAAIAGSKIAPNFGSQNIVTTGTATVNQIIANSNSIHEIKRDAGSSTNGAYIAYVIDSHTTGTPGDGFGTGIQAKVDGVEKGRLQFFNNSDLKISTGSNSVAITIDANQKVGIGTASPTDLLNLEFSSDNSTVAEGLFLNNTAGNTGDNVSLAFSTDSGNRKKSAISHVDEGPYGRGSLTFSIDGADTGSLDIVADEKFRINYDGNIGIGSADPVNKLHCVSSDYQTARFESSAADANGAYIELYANSSSPADDDISGLISFKGNDSGGNETTYAQIRSYLDDVTDGTEDGSLTFHTRANGSFGQRLRIASDGNIGVGIADPTDLLDLHNSTNNSRLLRLSHPSSPAGAAGFLGFNTDGTTDNVIFTLGCQYSNNYYNVLNIKRSNRNVGIGTTNPSSDLHIASSWATIRLEDSDVANGASYALITSSSNGNIALSADPDDVRSGSDLRFNVDGVERLRINNDGRVYFGDYADAATQAYIESSGDSPWALTISASNSTSTDRGIVFRLRPGHKAAEFDTNGHLKFPAGHGISFDAYGTGTDISSNILDDYEEGLWDLSSSKCNVDLHDNYDKGWYVKVGHMVTCGAYVQSDETSTDSSTNLEFTLPFATSGIPTGGDGAWVGAASCNSFALATDVTQTTIAAGDATAVATIRLNGGYAVGWSTLKKNQFTDAKLMQFTLTYKCQ